MSDDDIDDITLLKSCSREDLFNLILTEPKYYLDIIKDNKLEHELSIFVDNDYNIKFKIFPDDRWTEVGFFSNGSIPEIIDEFKVQVNYWLHKSRSGKKYEHLVSQLDSNNDMLSTSYGNDLNKLTNMKNIKDMNNLKSLKKHKSTIIKPDNLLDTKAQNIKDSLTDDNDSPVDHLNKFVAMILNKIIQEIPKIIEIPKSIDYYGLVLELKKLDPPETYKTQHDNLIENIKCCHYLQSVQNLTNWDKYDGIHEYLVKFHREAMKKTPHIYSKIKKPVLLSLLDADDLLILKKYSLDVSQIWNNYLS
jgi:hypothetical protein